MDAALKNIIKLFAPCLLYSGTRHYGGGGHTRGFLQSWTTDDMTGLNRLDKFGFVFENLSRSLYARPHEPTHLCDLYLNWYFSILLVSVCMYFSNFVSD